MTDFREARAALWGFLVLGFFFCAVLGSGYVNPSDFWLLFRTYLGMGFALWFAVGIFATAGMLWKNRPAKDGTAPSPFVLIRGWFETQWDENRLARTLWPPILFAMLLTSFNAFKQKILATQGFAFDPVFAEADRWLFFGQDGWRFFHDWFGSPTATGLIDASYHAWFVPMSVGVMVCAFLGASHYRLRTQYLLTYLFVWIGLGSVMAFLMPSAGPCFYNLLVAPQQSYAEMMAVLNAHNAALEASGGHVQALSNMQGLLNAREADGLVIGGGISAMPSVHNGLSVLFAIAAFRFSRVAGYALSAYAVLIWVGSVYLGWHYGLDGIVSAVLVIGFWKLSGRLADAIARPVHPWSKLAAA
ncbi:phosphatase PAP2 family protein [uncultured Parasphingopyxis sp.]|uniref:phosphatase PAP2 family protein n=1 Tax=uncultured Parasphingopyxis sp. TaxID=1547918 RepID=UPI0026316F24|nr:phosphatase PAP2 family protein [uncultured Parasphingopyxis sp.]